MLYEHDFLWREECRHPGGEALTRHGLALCGFPPRARIADVGCGAGASLRVLREQGCDCVGFDLRPPAAAAHHPEDDWPIIPARAEALPLTDEYLDGLICECVLSLLPEPELALKEFWRVCRPGGRLMLSDIYLKDGAPAAVFSRRELEAALNAGGWEAPQFEDCPRALKEFAARLLWRAEDGSEPWPTTTRGKDIPWRACGYGLWVARKRRFR